VLSLKTQKRKLQAYQTSLAAAVARETEAARTLAAAGRRERALLALRKRAESRRLIEQTEGWLLQLEQTLVQLDSSQRTAQLLGAMKSGAEVLQQLTRTAQLADVESLMEDTAEAAEATRSLQQALEGGRGESQEEAEAELEELMAAMEAEELPTPPRAVPTAPAMPAAPAAPRPAEAAREEPTMLPA